jgi:hypothetical protein
MTRNSAPVNPHKVHSIAAEPISRANLAAFRTLATNLLAQLAERPAQVADGTPVPSTSRTN